MKLTTELCNFIKFPLALVSGLGEIKLTEHEKRVMNEDWNNFLWQSDFSQSFLAWRRRLLYCASAILTFTTALQVTGFVTEDQDTACKFTALGYVTFFSSQLVSPVILLVSTFIAAWFWTDYSKSRKVLVPGWIAGMLLVLWPSILPLDYLLKDEEISASSVNAYPETSDAAIAVRAALGISKEKIFQGIVYAVGILPTYLSIMAGLTVGSKHVFKFAPSPMTGGMLVLSAAFAMIIPFAAMTLMVQLFGDGLLVAGISGLLMGPMIILIHCNHLTSVDSDSPREKTTKSTRILLCDLFFRLAGLLTILVWFLTFTKDGLVLVGSKYIDGRNIVGLLEYWAIAEMIANFLGRTLFSAVLWTDIVMYVTRNDEQKIKKLVSDLVE